MINRMKHFSAFLTFAVVIATAFDSRAEEMSPGDLTLRRMTAVASAVVAYTQRHGSFPAAGEAQDLGRRLREFVWKDDRAHFAAEDEWGTPFAYEILDDGRAFRLVSAGADRKFDRESWNRAGAFPDHSEDVVLLATMAKQTRSRTARELQVSSELVRRWGASESCH